MQSFKQFVHVLLLIASVVLWAAVSNGCVAAAVGAGAGAAGAITYTDRGAAGSVKGSTSEVDGRTLAVFRQMGIKVTKTSTQDGERKVVGQAGKREVNVDIKSTGKDTSKVEVVANKGFLNLEWDKDYAKSVLSRIVLQG